MSLLLACLLRVAGLAYPLDGLEESGIRRLQGYLLAEQTPGAAKLWPGQLLGSEQIALRLLDYDGPDFDALPEDPDLAGFLAKTLRQRDPSYGMVLVDMTDAGRSCAGPACGRT